MPLASIGEKSGFNDALAVLKNIDGMTGAKFIFRETAVRFQHDPDRTDVNTISTILRFIGFNFNDDPIFQDIPIEGVVNI